MECGVEGGSGARWGYPRDNERNVVAACLHLGSFASVTWALVSLDWFHVEGRCRLPLHRFLTRLDPPDLVAPQYRQFDCVSDEAEGLLRVLVLLCLVAIFCSMVGFCLDIIGPTKSSLRFVRRNALPAIWQVVTVVCIVGVCYLVSRSLEMVSRPNLAVHVAYQSGPYVVTAAGAISLLATACNLLQDAAPVEQPPAGTRLMEDFEGLETFSVGMHSLPPPPPYTP